MYLLGTSIIIAGILVIISREITHSLFALIVTFTLSSLLFILQGNPLFGYIYLLVYTAAISILFLFVIMMLELPQTAKISSRSLILILLVGISIYLGLDLEWNTVLNHSYHIEWKIEYLDIMQVMAYYLYTEQAFLLLLLVYGLLLVMVCIMLSLLN